MLVLVELNRMDGKCSLVKEAESHVVVRLFLLRNLFLYVLGNGLAGSLLGRAGAGRDRRERGAALFDEGLGGLCSDGADQRVEAGLVAVDARLREDGGDVVWGRVAAHLGQQVGCHVLHKERIAPILC